MSIDEPPEAIGLLEPLSTIDALGGLADLDHILQQAGKMPSPPLVNSLFHSLRAFLQRSEYLLLFNVCPFLLIQVALDGLTILGPGNGLRGEQIKQITT